MLKIHNSPLLNTAFKSRLILYINHKYSYSWDDCATHGLSDALERPAKGSGQGIKLYCVRRPAIDSVG